MLKPANSIITVIFYLFSAVASAGPILDRVLETKTLQVIFYFSGSLIPGNYTPSDDIISSNLFSDNNEEVKISGFNADVAEEIAKRLGVKVVYVSGISQSYFRSGRSNGEWDLVIGYGGDSFVGNFSVIGTYFYEPYYFVTDQDNTSINRLQDLKGRTILHGTSQYEPDYFKGTLEENLKALDAAPGLVNTVSGVLGKGVFIEDKIGSRIKDYLTGVSIEKVGKIDGMLLNFSSWHYWSQQMPLKKIEPAAFYIPQLIRAEKTDPEFTKEIQKILASMHQDGTLSKLSIKWFKADLTKPGK